MIPQNRFIRTYFIREFTKQLILNSKQELNKNQIKNYEESVFAQDLKSLSIIPSPFQSKIQNQTLQVPQISETNTEINNNTGFSYSTPQIQKLEATKIGLFLKDPAIQAIECQGPGKPISIKRNNQVISSPLNLEEQEIKNIIQALSKESNTPLQENLLKASTQDYHATAIISDVVGSRFAIYKT